MSSPKPPARRLHYFGDYELLEEIARGGMGIVYRARQVSLNRIVAVKVLLFGKFSSDEFVQRFKAEAEAAAALQHPNLVAIHEVGEHEGQRYFSMDYIEGKNLAELVRDKTLPARQAATMLRTVAEAIHYAHQHGVLHRDLKPSNVLIDLNGQPHVTDFGLAKRLEGDSELTVTGQVLGSPNYMPPEQAERKRGRVSAASDVYSLGAILYHLLTGRPPFVAETLEDTLLQLLNTEPVSPRLLNASVPRDLETICLKCLNKNPETRYGSAIALAEDLERWLAGRTILARPATSVERAWRWARRNPAIAGLSSAVFLILVAGVIVSTWQALRANRFAFRSQKTLEQLELNLYAADIYLAQNAIKEGNHGLARRALLSHVPRNGLPGLRSFEWCYFWNLCQGDKLAAWHLHSNVVTSVAVSADGKMIASASRDHEVKVLDFSSHRTLATLPYADAVAFSPDGLLLLTVSQAGRVQVFKVGAWERTAEFTTGDEPWKSPSAQIATSPTEPLVAVCNDGSLFGGRGTVHLYNYSTGLEVGRLPNSGDRMAFSGDGKTLVTGNAGGRIKIWDVATRKELKHLSGFGGSGVASLTLSSDGRLLATTAFWSGSIRLWDMIEGRELSPLVGHQRMAWQVVFSPDAKTLASGSSDQTIQIWDVESRRQLRTLVGHASEVWSLAYSPDGKYLVSGSKDETVALWPTGTARQSGDIPVANTVISPPIFSPDESIVAAATGGESVRDLMLWDLSAETRRTVLPGQKIGLWFSPDAKTLLTLGTNELNLWNLANQTVLKTIILKDRASPVAHAVAANDGRLVAVSSRGGQIVTLWNVFSGIKTGEITGEIASGGVTFSPDNRFLAVFGGNLVEVWDVQSRNLLHTMRGHKAGVTSAAFSPDGITLASSSTDNTVKLWAVNEGRELATLGGHREGVMSVAFSPDGRTLASACADGTLKLWHVLTRREMASFKLLSLAWFTRFSPSGKCLAVAPGWGPLKMLNCPSLAEIDASITKESADETGQQLDSSLLPP